MKTLIREDTPYAIRVVIAAGAFGLAIVAWLSIVNGTRFITIATVTLGVVVLMAAFLALGVLRTRRSPLVPFWTSLAIGIVWCSLMIVSIGAPYWGSLALLGAVALLSAATGIAVNRQLCGARVLIVAMAVLGIYGVVAVPVAVWNGGGPLISGTGAPVAVLGAACLAAIWHARQVN